MDAIEKLLNDIKENGVVIIGAGLIAKRFYIGLESNQLADKVVCFAVSNMGKNPDKLFGKAVVELKDLEINPKVITCIAGHRYIAEELTKAAEVLGLRNIIWVGDLANKMLWGQELGIKSLSPVEIMHNSEDAKYNLAVRYLAAAQSYGKNDYGWDYYYRAMAHLYSKELATNRVARYKDLVKNIKEEGYNRQKSPVYVDSKYRILDGFHRLSVARFLELDEIGCQVYEAPNAFDLNESMYLTEEMLLEAGFSGKDIAILQETADKMVNK